MDKSLEISVGAGARAAVARLGTRGRGGAQCLEGAGPSPRERRDQFGVGRREKAGGGAAGQETC